MKKSEKICPICQVPHKTKAQKEKQIKEMVKIIKENKKLELKYWNEKKKWSRSGLLFFLRMEWKKL